MHCFFFVQEAEVLDDMLVHDFRSLFKFFKELLAKNSGSHCWKIIRFIVANDLEARDSESLFGSVKN